MHYVIVRDDDTNALTPVECLEQLYRPFLDRGLPVNLATIPTVRTDTISPEGVVEKYLLARRADTPPTVPMTENPDLVRYLRGNPGFNILQHGCDHSLFEFGSPDRQEIRSRLQSGAEALKAAGFPQPKVFVAPYDRFSRVGLSETARRFRIISTGWFELRRLPFAWWPQYALKKMLKRSHWKVGNTLLLTHPGCLLSYRRPYATMLDSVKRFVESQEVAVVVTHWWEYFRDERPDAAMVKILHETAAWLGGHAEVRVVKFDDLLRAETSGQRSEASVVPVSVPPHSALRPGVGSPSPRG